LEVGSEESLCKKTRGGRNRGISLPKEKPKGEGRHLQGGKARATWKGSGQEEHHRGKQKFKSLQEQKEEN